MVARHHQSNTLSAPRYAGTVSGAIACYFGHEGGGVLVLQLAFHTMAILLGLVYCVIQPVMAAIVLLYFMVAYVFNKYQAIYVQRPDYESGGLVRGG